MKKINWTKADAKRAAKMGWELTYFRTIDKLGDRFKSDSEAIEWVITMMIAGYIGYGELVNRPEDIAACRKALFLCAKG